ncbi:MAG: hypothetical protein DRQ88_05275 [Epsilonproteobacteria bacterium]|nr:MAG: hypothetical protein DRQ89_04480 [Campylobacterota bacterium]RLA66840.1 MAG: hypothetical protein DRQ88_05275 [Campylobacterota bacterium]
MLKKSFAGKIRDFIFSSQGFPLLLMFSILGVLFVLFRMKSVELDYKITEINKAISKVRLEQKELNAKKAGLLSVNNLRKLAKRYKLKQPAQSQIIVIPHKEK